MADRVMLHNAKLGVLLEQFDTTAQSLGHTIAITKDKKGPLSYRKRLHREAKEKLVKYINENYGEPV